MLGTILRQPGELNNGEQPQDREAQFILQQPGGQRALEAVRRAEDRMQHEQGRGLSPGREVYRKQPTVSCQNRPRAPRRTAAELPRTNLPSPQPLQLRQPPWKRLVGEPRALDQSVGCRLSAVAPVSITLSTTGLMRAETVKRQEPANAAQVPPPRYKQTL